MKKILFTVFAVFTTYLCAQDLPTFGGDVSGCGYKPGELLVKFRDDTSVTKRRMGKRLTVGISAVDSVLSAIGANDMNQLMPLMGAKVSRRRVRDFNGKIVEDRDLSRLFCLEFDAKKNVIDAANSLSQLDEVEYAEPNYIVQIQGNVVDDYSSDPMYSQQWAYQALNMARLWTQPTITNKRPVIAIIDTGVDITHPDLKDNIWTNEKEEENGYDTDRNGFVDDIHGWDFINQTSRMGDYNGHGTHCAGIAAASGGNGIGVVGANPDALIMPITVMQSNGTGDIATIIKGIDYATANGADVISMSLGSSATSQAEEHALSKAYSRCLIVAAAGNSGRCINGEGCFCPLCGNPAGAMFPAAYTFVLGVMASQAGDKLACFSNFDCNGPVTSVYDEEKLYNYEISVPGTGILSTVPGGRYDIYNGTSMACPLAAGIASRVLQTKEVLSKELYFGDIIHATGPLVSCTGSPFHKYGGVVDIDKLLDASDETRTPNLHLVTVEYEDSLGDCDGRIDAGEIIDVYPVLRNDWGNANDVKVYLEFATYEDNTLCEFLTNGVPLGLPLSSYGKVRAQTPIRIKMRDNIVDGRIVRLQVRAECEGLSEDYKPTEIAFKVENGIELGGTQRQNITLYPGIQYIVSRNWGIPKDVTVTVKAGTTIKIKDNVGISNYGYMLFEGTPDSLITITKGDNDMGIIGGFLNDNANYCDFNYVLFDYLTGITFDGHRYNNCIFRNCVITRFPAVFSYDGTFRGCDIYYNTANVLGTGVLSSGATFIETSIHENTWADGFGSCARFYKSNYIGNEILFGQSSPDVRALEASNCFGNYFDFKELALENPSYKPGFYSVIFNTTEPEIFYLSDAYLGTASDKVAYEGILDSEDNIGWGTVDVWQKRNYAVEEAPVCVDYVTVDGLNPLDDEDQMSPLGIGRHLVEVGFNRAMNQDVHPDITMGVRPPYTQKSISEDGFWFDPWTYRAYITIDTKSATDGTNRIRINGYKAKGQHPEFSSPDEKYRYNVLVSAAGSMSTGLMAAAGLGKVSLQWKTDEEDFDDLLGYNIYRFTIDSIGESSDTIMVNKYLIQPNETSYVDYDVVPGQLYCYFIREIGTDLIENGVSSTISAVPLTAQKGDANGSFAVDIADVLAQVAYLSGENPQPFIFEAADVNSDNDVNILDVVATLRMITAPEAETESAENDYTAYYYVKEGKLYVETPVALGGVQVRVNATAENQLSACSDLAGLEQMHAQVAKDAQIFLAYSMSGRSIGTGNRAILELPEGVLVQDVVLSTPKGANVRVESLDATGISETKVVPEKYQEGIFDLSGRKLQSMPKRGVVIVNGKKLIL